MKKVDIYGIKNCSTMKKATSWLEEHHIDFQFHDYKKTGADEGNIRQWLTTQPWDQLINRRGTTWRKLSDEDKLDIDDNKAIQLMLSNPSLIKRPVLTLDNEVYLGFKAEQYEQFFSE